MEKVRVTIIPGTDGCYIASSDGKIYNRQGLEKSQVTDKWGYKTVGLRVDGKKKRFFVHRLVLMAFLPCDNMHALQVNHKDENKQNNNLSNLEWCTNEYNQRYGTKSARLSATRSHPIEAVDLMGNVVGRYSSATVAARTLGLCQSNIWAAVNGKREFAYGLRWRSTPMGV